MQNTKIVIRSDSLAFFALLHFQLLLLHSWPEAPTVHALYTQARACPHASASLRRGMMFMDCSSWNSSLQA